MRRKAMFIYAPPDGPFTRPNTTEWLALYAARANYRSSQRGRIPCPRGVPTRGASLDKVRCRPRLDDAASSVRSLETITHRQDREARARVAAHREGDLEGPSGRESRAIGIQRDEARGRDRERVPRPPDRRGNGRLIVGTPECAAIRWAVWACMDVRWLVRSAISRGRLNYGTVVSGPLASVPR